MIGAAGLQLCSGAHVVLFYEDERSLSAAAADSLAAALADGGTAIAIATAEHTAAFSSELRRSGVDVNAAERAGRLIFPDARQTLDQLLVDGMPDAGRFREVVGTLIAKVARGQGPVSAFGEMVGLLWSAGEADAVLALEQLWNDLLAEIEFSLLCAYPATALHDGRAHSIVPVCDSHSDVVSSLPAPASPEVERTFAKAPRSAARARAFVASTLRSWGVGDDLHDDAALVVSELAVNAIRHAQSGFKVSLGRVGGGIRIAVGDADRNPPARLNPGVHATSGRGLLLVDAVSAAWGSAPADAGKLVWAQLGGAGEAYA